MEMTSDSPMKYIQEDGTPLSGTDAGQEDNKDRAKRELGMMNAGSITGALVARSGGAEWEDIGKEFLKDKALGVLTGGLYNPELQRRKRGKLYASGYEEANVGASEI